MQHHQVFIRKRIKDSFTAAECIKAVFVNSVFMFKRQHISHLSAVTQGFLMLNWQRHLSLRKTEVKRWHSNKNPFSSRGQTSVAAYAKTVWLSFTLELLHKHILFLFMRKTQSCENTASTRLLSNAPICFSGLEWQQMASLNPKPIETLWRCQRFKEKILVLGGLSSSCVNWSLEHKIILILQ